MSNDHVAEPFRSILNGAMGKTALPEDIDHACHEALEVDAADQSRAEWAAIAKTLAAHIVQSWAARREISGESP